MIQGNAASPNCQPRSLPPVAWSAQDLEILGGSCPTHSYWDDVVKLKLILVTTMATAASIPTPHILLEVIGYSSPNLLARRGVHCDHRLRSLDTLLLALSTSHQQRVNLLSVETIIVPIKAALKLPVVPIFSREHENRMTLLTSAVRRPLVLR